MPVRFAGAAHAAGTGHAGAGSRRGRGRGGAGRGGGEGGKFLRQFRRTTVRTFRAFPVAGADQDFAVRFAFTTMKFVNWHGGNLPGRRSLLN
jgi:hypothetical protein